MYLRPIRILPKFCQQSALAGPSLAGKAYNSALLVPTDELERPVQLSQLTAPSYQGKLKR
jgi:hypothetical protein